MKINLNNKIFKALSNSENGEVSNETIFHYKQSENIIWADYSGGEIVKGNLTGKYIEENKIQFVYQHINKNEEIMTGKCTSKIEIDKNNKINLTENWQWTCKDFSKGKSKLIEK